MAGGSASARASELSPALAAGLIATFVLAGWGGFVWSGLGGAFFCALGATGALAAGVALSRMKASDRTRMDALPQLTQLPPAQALGLMSALTEREGGDAPFRSEVLARLDELAEQIDDAPADALEALETLREEHPRNPAIAEQLARCAFALEDPQRGHAAASRAVELALDGGMNPMAARVYARFEAHHDSLELQPRHWKALARVLAARGEEAASERCDANLVAPER